MSLPSSNRAVMRFLTIIASLCFLAACENTSPELLRESAQKPSPSQSLTPRFVPGEVLVKFKPEVSPERIAGILKETNTELITVLKGTQIHHVRIVGGESVESVVKKLSSIKEVEYAEPNYIRQMQK